MSRPDDTHDSSSVTKLLAERAKLEEKIRTEHTREVTIFFCDIKGYTSYTEAHGDLAGRALAQQVNEIAFPALDEFDGKMVKTIGDAIMAYFEDPAQAVRFSMKLQRELKETNKHRPKADQVRLRIGLNLGEVIVDEGDLYGDAVNIAARVEPQAKPTGILVSPAVYEKVQNTEDIVCKYAKKVMMKGKSEPMELYQVIWDGEREDDYSEDSIPAAPTAEEAAVPQPTGPSYYKWAAIIVLLLLAGIAYKTMYSGSGPEKTAIRTIIDDPYASGYSALKKGALDLASTAFAKLDKTDPRYSEALAALAYWKKDYDSTQNYLNAALQQADDRVFVHVLDGDLKLSKGKNDLAYESYSKATVLEKGLPWHKAMAFNGQGRILMAMKKNDDAMTSFAEATRLAPDEAEILSNYGVLLEKLGKTDQALEYFRKATKADPDDTLSRRKLALAERKEKAKLDKERQERIKQLVDELSAQFKSGKTTPVRSDSTEYSYPLSTWLMSFDEKGDLPPREGENDVYADLLGQELQGSGSFELVERDLLDSLLVELKLGSSDLADQQTSLKLGRLLAAKFIIKGSIYRRGPVTLVSFKVVETETSRIRASASLEINGNEGLFLSAGKVAEEIRARIGKVFPDLAAIEKPI